MAGFVQKWLQEGGYWAAELNWPLRREREREREECGPEVCRESLRRHYCYYYYCYCSCKITELEGEEPEAK